jgi:hypothetical protein
MASMARSLTSVDVWERFRSVAECRVDEGNCTAGERLWEVVPSQDPEAALTIRSTRWVADTMECAFDLASGALTCAPGEAIGATPLTFQVLPGRLRRGSRDYTVEEAVSLVLDKLVWDDEQGDRP